MKENNRQEKINEKTVDDKNPLWESFMDERDPGVRLNQFVHFVSAENLGEQPDRNPTAVLQEITTFLNRLSPSYDEFKDFMLNSYLPAIAGTVPVVAPMSGGSLSLMPTDTVAEKVNSFFELGPVGKRFIATASIAGGFLAWGINMSTSANGMSGDNKPEPVLLGIGAMFNIAEMAGLHAITSQWGLKEALHIRKALGINARPDQVQKAMVLAMGITLGSVFAFDAVTTAEGLKHMFGKGAMYDIMRYVYGIAQTIFTEAFFGAGETMWRSAADESQARSGVSDELPEEV